MTAQYEKRRKYLPYCTIVRGKRAMTDLLLTHIHFLLIHYLSRETKKKKFLLVIIVNW